LIQLNYYYLTSVASASGGSRFSSLFSNCIEAYTMSCWACRSIVEGSHSCTFYTLFSTIQSIFIYKI